MFAGRPFAAVAAGAAALALLAAGARAARTVVASLPSTVDRATARPLTLDRTANLEQSFVAPACPLTQVRVLLDRPPAAPARVAAELRTIALGSERRDERLMATSVIVTPLAAGSWLSFAVPAVDDSWRRTFVLHLELVDGEPLVLAARISNPMWPGQLRRNGAWLGNQVLAFDALGGSPSVVSSLGCAVGGTGRAAFLLGCGALMLILVALLVGLAVSPAYGNGGRLSRYLPPTLALASGILWLAFVPPFEGPDEVAHLQYARFVATTASLPTAVPDPESPWRDSFYEWVQPPLHYVGAAVMLRTLGLSTEPPHLEPNPRSRVAAGPERTVYLHSRGDTGQPALSALLAIRTVNLLCMVAVVLVSAALVREHLGNPQLATLAAGGAVLVPQWTAALTMATNDATATLAAALSSLVILRLARGGQTRPGWLVAGALAGLALATKLTTAFLIPMAVCAMATPHRSSRRVLNAAAAFASGLAAGGGWFILRNAVVFGEPLAGAFKRAILEQSGFLALSRAQPGPLEAAFWTGLEGQVFEAFWARFGSLGAGPDIGSRVWWIYGTLTALLMLASVIGGVGALAPLRRHTTRSAGAATWVSVTAFVGVVAGLGSWILVNVLGRADVVVHWTPRHILPLSPVLLLLTASGLQAARRDLGGPRTLWRAGAAAVVVALGLGWIVSLRFAIQHLHRGH